MAELLADKGYAIVGDLHGQADLLKRAADIIDPGRVTFVVQDVLDRGLKVKECLEFAKEIGAICLADNHSWVCGNALMYDEHGEYGWLRSWYNFYENNTMGSFGLIKTGNAVRDGAALKEKIHEAGLLSLILDTTPYLDPDGDNFIATHAGVLPVSWASQKTELDSYVSRSERWNSMPPQIFDDDKFTYSNSEVVPKEATDKKVITGHSHLRLPGTERVTDHGNRIRLASNLQKGDPLFIFLTQTSELIEISQSN